eukprot:8628433-Pyramimonas_sp.AAC.1
MLWGASTKPGVKAASAALVPRFSPLGSVSPRGVKLRGASWGAAQPWTAALRSAERGGGQAVPGPCGHAQ